MEECLEPWTLTSLTRLFAADPEALGDVDVTVPQSGDVICVTLKEKGDMDVFVAVSGERDILASIVLVPCDDVPSRADFERMVLKTHKFVPLSSFGITIIDGEEWYELFGSLSTRSRAETVVEEVAILAANAVDAAVMIDEWKNGEMAA
ncbi:YjfI family protein [Agrobacterium vitis]|uniref:YjfI family protein n=1 Tax=Agrobacterium vitis TaxID=373 RepID=UPI00157313A6|nr:YjfI family protein [Agrobacterium vitis]NSZ18667.1 YjfI family protein [Agrobacterium vitis]QZO06554.1 YjfI family protein [Agrobacterium vitis]UJL90005.1 YjfI family protein [Agrobacterium vitis]